MRDNVKIMDAMKKIRRLLQRESPKEYSAKAKKVYSNMLFLIQWFIALYAIMDDVPIILEREQDVNLSLMHYIFAYFRNYDGWGMEKAFIGLGIGIAFYIARSIPSQGKWLKGFSAFLAVCSVFGKSYLAYNSWDFIFKWWLQFIFAVFTMLGYYFIFLHFLSLGLYLLKKKSGLLRIDTKNRIENFLFEKHPFKMTFCIAILFQLPYFIAFFPGTLSADAFNQLYGYLGAIEMHMFHPVMSTMIMGKCIDLGRFLFHSDSMGMFFFTGSQIIFQSLAIAFMVWFFRKISAPILVRWFALAYFLILPLFPLWGLTFTKDTFYYIFTMFFVTVLACIIYNNMIKEPSPLWQNLLLIASVIGMAAFRRETVFLIIPSIVVLLMLYRSNWKLWILTGGVCLITCYYIEKVYVPSLNITQRVNTDALSIPFQQTARYLVEYGDDVTTEEKEELEQIFNDGLSDIAGLYNPDLSDPVKNSVKSVLSDEQLKNYFTIWKNQFFRHPDSYIQSFINNIYGYFYPDKKEIQHLYIQKFNGWEKWEDEYLSVGYAIENDSSRNVIDNYIHSLYNMPVIGLFFSPGFHVYLLLGCLFCLIGHKKGRQAAVLIPSFCKLLICLASPVNASVRYTLPIMAVLPLNIAWCICIVRNNLKGK